MKWAVLLLLIVALAAPVAAQAPKPPSGPPSTPVPEPSKSLPVAAYVGGDGLRVTWPPVAGTVRACVLRPGPRGGAQLLYCAPGPPIAFLPQDAGRIVRPGETLELRLYSAQFEVITQAWFTVMWAVYLPSIQKPLR